MTKKRILIIDDEIGFTRLLKHSLEQTGNYEARVENYAGNALQAAETFQPDLVLMDIFMPGMSGGDVAAQFRSSTRVSSIPIVFLTAAISRSRMKEHEGFVLGTRIIAKPASLEEILSGINDCLTRAPGERGGSVDLGSLPDGRHESTISMNPM